MKAQTFEMPDMAQTAHPSCSEMFQVKFWHAAPIRRE